MSLDTKRYLSLWVPVFVWAAFIFIGSAIPNADFSSNLETERLIHLYAHILEYSGLGFLLTRAFSNSVSISWVFSGLLVFFTSVAYAFTDEFHQLFTVGRIAKLTDVRNDSFGALLGIILYLVVRSIFIKFFKISKVFVSHSAEQTQKYGQKLAKSLRGGEVIMLEGELGSGKTELVKGIFSDLGCKGKVLSPTFVLQRIYSGGRLPLIHADLYRLNDPREVEKLDLLDFVQDGRSVLVVEWANNAPGLWPKDAIRIKLEYNGQMARKIMIHHA